MDGLVTPFPKQIEYLMRLMMAIVFRQNLTEGTIYLWYSIMNSVLMFRLEVCLFMEPAILSPRSKVFIL